mgnify:CR=1 FL=1
MVEREARRDAEVGHLDKATLVDENIVWLDVTVNDTYHFVAVVQGLYHINQILFYFTRF